MYLAALLCIMSGAIEAQTTTQYYSIDYMKVAPENQEDYMACEMAWKKIHAEKMRLGLIEGWALERVISPSGTSQEYNYITRQRFKNTDQLAAYQSNPYFPTKWESLLTAEEIELIGRTGELRSLVKGEVWSSADLVLASDISKENFTVFNYFKMPEGMRRADHMEMELSLWKPYHQSQVDQGNRLGWVLLNRELPMGGSYDYDLATVDIFENLEQFWAPFDEDEFERLHPGKTWEDIWNATASKGKRGRAEIRRSLDSISRGDSASTSSTGSED